MMGHPHCIIGHFGRIESLEKHYECDLHANVRVTHGPNGGPVDRRIVDANERDGTDIWPMSVRELEAVD
jgi:hypothetical protein